MASGTLYTARLVGPEILEAGMANDITCAVYRDGAAAVLTTAGSSLSLWDATGTKLLDAAAVDLFRDLIAAL